MPLPTYAEDSGANDQMGIARLSHNLSGQEGNLDSLAPAISANGRFVAFASEADNLVASDTNGLKDIFRQDRQSGQIMRITGTWVELEANGESRRPAITANGSVIVFESMADNLGPQDTNAFWDIYAYNVATREMIVVSAGGNGNSVHPAVSADGRYITFVSLADNLVPADTNGKSDIFVYDTVGGDIQRVSVGEAGIQSNNTTMYPAISADGQYITYQSRADNLAGSGNGYYFDIFLYDRTTGQTSLVSQNAAGVIGNHESQRPAISSDGRYIAYESWADNLVPNDNNGVSDIFVYDRLSETVERVSLHTNGSETNGVSGSPDISMNGRYVTFASLANNLATSDFNETYDVFVHDRDTDETALVSFNERREAANGSSMGANMAGGGRFIVFDSLATDLVGGDTNGRTDVFLYDKFMSVSFTNAVYFPIMAQQ